jgi:hypothetical protein
MLHVQQRWNCLSVIHWHEVVFATPLLQVINSLEFAIIAHSYLVVVVVVVDKAIENALRARPPSDATMADRAAVRQALRDALLEVACVVVC